MVTAKTKEREKVVPAVVSVAMKVLWKTATDCSALAWPRTYAREKRRKKYKAGRYSRKMMSDDDARRRRGGSASKTPNAWPMSFMLLAIALRSLPISQTLRIISSRVISPF